MTGKAARPKIHPKLEIRSFVGGEHILSNMKYVEVFLDGHPMHGLIAIELQARVKKAAGVVTVKMEFDAEVDFTLWPKLEIEQPQVWCGVDCPCRVKARAKEDEKTVPPPPNYQRVLGQP